MTCVCTFNSVHPRHDGNNINLRSEMHKDRCTTMRQPASSTCACVVSYSRLRGRIMSSGQVCVESGSSTYDGGGKMFFDCPAIAFASAASRLPASFSATRAASTDSWSA